MSEVLWDTVWATDPITGTVGNWNISTGYEPSNVGGLQNMDPIGTAVLLALFTDARLPDWMIGRFGFTKADQQEWHGNTVGVDAAAGEEPLGSLLWTLRRAPCTEYTARMAEHFTAMALQPLIRQKIVMSFDIQAEVDRNKGLLSIFIRAFGETEREWVAELYPIQ
jgi:phage gp46-like protein